MTNLIFLSIIIALAIFSGLLLVQMEDNKSNIRLTKKFFEEHGINENDYWANENNLD